MAAHPPGAWSDDEGLRWYTFQAEDYLSVTSQRKVLGMPYRLHNWVLGQLAEGVIANPMSVVPEAGELPEDHVRRVKRFATIKRDAAGDRGTQVHDLIASGTPMKDVPEEMQPYVESYARAVIALGIQPLLVERQVFNRKFRYAGSFDLLARLRSKRSYVIDLKTGSGTYPEHAIQALGYLRCDFVAKDDEVDEQATALLKEADGAAILHIYPATEEEPKGWRFYDLRLDPAIEQAYKAQCVLARWYAHFRDIGELEVKT